MSSGKARVAKAVADDGNHALVDEPAGGLADQQFLFGELRIDEEIIDAVEFAHIYRFSISPTLRRRR